MLSFIILFLCTTEFVLSRIWGGVIYWLELIMLLIALMAWILEGRYFCLSVKWNKCWNSTCQRDLDREKTYLPAVSKQYSGKHLCFPSNTQHWHYCYCCLRKQRRFCVWEIVFHGGPNFYQLIFWTNITNIFGLSVISALNTRTMTLAARLWKLSV